MKTASLSRVAACKSPENVMRSPRCRASNSGRNCSWIGTSPLLSAASFFFVIVDQDNLVSQIRKTHSGYQPYISGTDHRDAHSEPALLYFHLHLRLVGVHFPTVAVFPALTAATT